MLAFIIVQILGVCAFIGAIAALVLGGPPIPARRESAHEAAVQEPVKWTEVAWVAGAGITVVWPIAVLVVPSFAYHWPAPPDFPALGALQLAGFAVSIAAGILFLRASRALGRFMTPVIQVRPDHELIQDGPYRYIRHPLYTAIVASAVGLSVLFLSPVLALVTVVLIGMAVYRAHLEENLLSSPQAFGNTYREYMRRTGRFLPPLRSRR